jgi:hypothetical protein
MVKENHLATEEDFRRAAKAQAEVERVVLPKLGKAVLLRRPSPMWFVFRGRLPQSLSASLFSGTGENTASTIEELNLLADWIVALLREVMLEPRVSLEPGAGEIAPELLDVEDVNFIIRWAYGEVGPDAGRDDLAAFRGKRESAASGPSGRDLVMPAQRAS